MKFITYYVSFFSSEDTIKKWTNCTLFHTDKIEYLGNKFT